MCWMLLLLFCVFVTVNSIPTAIPWHIQCKSGDDACVTKAAQAAYPLMLKQNTEIGAEELDPMFQELMISDTQLMKINFFNTTITGFKTCEVVKAKLNETADSIKVELFCKKFTLKGQYDLVARKYHVSAKGNGDYFLDTGEYNIIVDLVLETLTKDGMTFRTIKNFTAEAEALAPLKYVFQGINNDTLKIEDETYFKNSVRSLVPGTPTEPVLDPNHTKLKLRHDNNEMLRKIMVEIIVKALKENWKKVAQAHHLPIFNAYIKQIINNANKYLKILLVK